MVVSVKRDCRDAKSMRSADRRRRRTAVAGVRELAIVICRLPLAPIERPLRATGWTVTRTGQPSPTAYDRWRNSRRQVLPMRRRDHEMRPQQFVCVHLGIGLRNLGIALLTMALRGYLEPWDVYDAVEQRPRSADDSGAIEHRNSGRSSVARRHPCLELPTRMLDHDCAALSSVITRTRACDTVCDGSGYARRGAEAQCARHRKGRMTLPGN